jgi:RNA polymerase sigma-70 factor (ECF subfamily)
MTPRPRILAYSGDQASLPDAMAEPMARASSMGIDEIVRLYSKYVATIALRLLGRHDEVDDVVQEVFLTAMKGLAGLRDDRAVRSWLATVTVRTARRRLQQRRWYRRVGLDEDPEYEETLAAPGATPEELSMLARIYTLLDTLPVDERVAWSLRHIHGDGLEAIAEACGCSLATAKRRISAAQSAIETLVVDD